MAATNGAADAVTQMIARICPVGIDSRMADQRLRNFPVRSPCKRSIERPEDETQALTTRFRRKQVYRKVSVRRETVETFKRPQAMSQLTGRPDRFDDESSWLGKARAGNRELEMPVVMPQ